MGGVAEWGVTQLLYEKMSLKDLKAALYIADDVKADQVRFAMDINKKDKNGRVALHHVVDNGREEVAHNMIEEQDANPNATDKRLRTPLHVAAMAGQAAAITMLFSEHEVD